MINNIEDINILNSPYGGYYFYYYRECCAYTGPFGNCQNFAINNFCYLLEDNEEDDIEQDDKYLAENLNNFLYCISRHCGKSLAVIDVNQWAYETLNDFIKDYDLNISFVADTPYTSSNQSSMRLCILNLDELKLIQ